MVRSALSPADFTVELEAVDAGWTVELPRPTRHRPKHRRDNNLLFKIILTITVFAVALCVGFYYKAWDAYYGGTPETNHHQQDLAKQFQAQIGGSGKQEPLPIPGKAYAKLTIPRMNKSWIVVQGTSVADIANAPGHYDNTAAPCDKGNFSVAGHRSAAIFGDVDDLKIGDPIIVQTHTRICTYLVTASFVTVADDWAVVAPMPDSPGEKPKGDFLTLTTCEPWNSTDHRLIIHAKLSKEEKL